jgi:hypothetical protein
LSAVELAGVVRRRVDEGMIVSRFFDTKGIVNSENVRRGLLDHNVSRDLQQAQHGCLPGTTGEDVSRHGTPPKRIVRTGMAHWDNSRMPR